MKANFKKTRSSGLASGLMSRASVAAFVAATSSMATFTPVVAQDDGATDESRDSIIVTATRREQTVQEIPYNISSFSEEFLKANRITDINEVARMIPGVSFIDQGPNVVGGDNRLILRGLNANGIGTTGTFTNNTVAPVSTYVGETPIFYPMRLEDLARVEVLRGPQGTLYGSGSLSGTIRFIPNRPDPEAFTASAKAGVSTTKDADDVNYEFSSVVNLPLGESAALRVGAGYEKGAGFIDAKNLVARDSDDFFLGVPIPSVPGDLSSGYTFLPTVEDINDSEGWYARAALLWEPTESLSFLATYQHEDASQDASQTANPFNPGATIDPSASTIPGSPGVNTAGCPGGGFVGFVTFGGFGDCMTPAFAIPAPNAATTFPATGRNESSKLLLDPSERQLDLYALEVEVDLGFASLTSATSYYDKEQVDDTHGVGVWWVPRGLAASNLASFYGFYPRFTVPLRNAIDEDGFTQEARLVSTWDKPLDYIFGVYYQDIDYVVNTDQFFPGINDFFLGTFGFPGANPQLGDRDFDFDKSWQFEEIALFGELTYHITEQWQVTGGIRVFWQDYATQTVQLLPFCGAFCSNDGVDPLGRTEAANTAEFQDQIFRANTSYEINDDTMVYFNWAEGFRRGGANGIAIAGVFASLPEFTTFEPDQSTNYEIGIKGTLGDKVNYTVAGFWLKWDNFQFDTASPAGAPYVANGNAARSRGFEIELNGQLTERLSFLAGYAYADAEATENFVLQDATIGGLFTDPPTITDVTSVSAGDKLPGSLEHSASWAVDYLAPLNDQLDLNFHVNGSYRSSTTSAFPETNQGLNLFEIDGFTMWDASITLQADAWSARFFVDNLGDQQGITGGLGAAVATTVGQYRYVTRPRTFGLQLSYDIN